MRAILRSFIFSYVALYATSEIIRGFDFGKDAQIDLLLVSTALAAFSILAKPLFKVVSLPSKGLGKLVVEFLSSLGVLYGLTVFLPSFSFVETELPRLKFFGFVLPSTELVPIASLVFSALFFGVLVGLLNWVCFKKR